MDWCAPDPLTNSEVKELANKSGLPRRAGTAVVNKPAFSNPDWFEVAYDCFLSASKESTTHSDGVVVL